MKQHLIKTLVTIALAALFIGCEHEVKPPKTEVRKDEPAPADAATPTNPAPTPRPDTR